MKKNNLLKTVLLFVFAVFLLQGCRSEENALEKSNPSTEYKIIHQNYSLVQKNNNLNQKFTLLENIATANKKKSEKQNSENIIEIDGIKIFKDYVTYVSPIDSSKNTYSFYVENSNYRLAPNSVQNMVFSKKENETDYSSYLVTYTFPEGINSNNKNFNITKIEKLNISSLFSKKSNTANNRLTAKTSSNCPETYSYEIIETKHKCKSGEHSGDSQVGDCNLKGDERPYSTYVIKITTMTADCGTESWGTPESGSSGPGGGSGGASGSTAPSVDTSISLPPTCQTGDCNEEILANKINTSLGLPLDYNKLLWLNSNTEFAEGIWNMLSNDNSEATKNFATWGISFAASNNTSWTQFQKWFMNADGTTRITFDSSVNASNGVEINTAEELNNILSYKPSTTISYDGINQANEIISNFKFRLYQFHDSGVQVFVKTANINQPTFKLSNVTVGNYGISLFHDTKLIDKTDIVKSSSDTSGNTYYFNMVLEVSRKLFIQGIGTYHTMNYNVAVFLDKKTGKVTFVTPD